ncbi:hypothetical protein L249_6700, partial [Ophiocordyceps polyrhachis-furcata BCC 54312]
MQKESEHKTLYSAITFIKNYPLNKFCHIIRGGNMKLFTILGLPIIHAVGVLTLVSTEQVYDNLGIINIDLAPNDYNR